MNNYRALLTQAAYGGTSVVIDNACRNDNCHGDEHLMPEISAQEELARIQAIKAKLESDEGAWEEVGEEIFNRADYIDMLKLIRAKNFDGAYQLAQAINAEFMLAAQRAYEDGAS